MPITTQSITLEASAPSVAQARTWILSALAQIGRDDLHETAELGVSELVTNALSYGLGPIAVTLTGRRAQPRIEVRDHSTARLRFFMRGDAEESGRGLVLVALASRRCGVDYDDEAGAKTVWFEPAETIGVEADLSGFAEAM